MKENSIIQENKAMQSTDKKLVFNLTENMYAGIALMAQAQHKRLAPDVIDLAEKMQLSHIKLTEELKMYASDQHWLIAAGEKEEDIQYRQQMADKNGEEYQQEWFAVMQQKHEAAIQMLENAQPEDSKLQNLVEKTASKLKDMLNDITDVQQKVS